MYQIQPQNDPFADTQTQVSHTQVVSRIACDAGNRQVKFGQSTDSIRLVPSVIKELHPFDEPVLEPASITVRYVAGENKALVGQRWVVGSLAAELNGLPVFKTEKSDVMAQLALAAIEPKSTDSKPLTLAINELRLCLPDDRDSSKVDSIRSSLRGFHQIERDGVEMAVKIRSVIIEPEGASAFKWCKAQGLFKYVRPNGILDFGGGNSTAQLFSVSGMLLRESRLTLPGTFALAQSIASDPCLIGVESKGLSPKSELILDGIANGSYTYGSTGYSFAGIFEPYRNNWINSIRNELRTRWSEWLPQLGEVVMIGGSAVLAAPLVEATKGRFKVAPDAAIATTRGMLL